MSAKGTVQAVVDIVYGELPWGECAVSIEEEYKAPVPLKPRWRRVWNAIWGKETTQLEDARGCVHIVVMHESGIDHDVQDRIRESLEHARPCGVLFTFNFMQLVQRSRRSNQRRFPHV